MLTANFHTHSTFCDGTSTPGEMVERALQTDEIIIVGPRDERILKHREDPLV